MVSELNSSFLNPDPFAYMTQQELMSMHFSHPYEILKIPQIRQKIAIRRWKEFQKNGQFKYSPYLDAGILKETLIYNQQMIPKSLYALNLLERPRYLIDPVMCLDKLGRSDLQSFKILTIGPRTEYEILMLYSYGFKPDNISGLDLISYSPWIDVGDMHDMPYSSNSFDLVIMGWVFAYSEDLEKVAHEVVRVTKPGGIISNGNNFIPDDTKAFNEKRIRMANCQEMLSYFPYVDTLYFQNAPPTTDFKAHDGGDPHLITIFDIKKPPSPEKDLHKFTQKLLEPDIEHLLMNSAAIAAFVDWPFAPKVYQLLREYFENASEQTVLCLVLKDEERLNEAYENLLAFIEESELVNTPELLVFSEQQINNISVLENIWITLELQSDYQAQFITQDKIQNFPNLQPIQAAMADIQQELALKRQEIQAIERICKQLATQFLGIPESYTQDILLGELQIFRQGFQRFIKTNEFSQSAFESMRLMSTISKGQLRQAVKEAYARIYPPQQFDNPTGLLTAMQTEIPRILESIETDGYSCLPVTVPPLDCQAIYQFARKASASPVPSLPEGPDKVIYNPQQIVAATYWISEAESIQQATVQKLLFDPSLLNFVQQRLQSAPILSHVGIWWSVPPPAGNGACSESAQLFHIDMDRMCFFHLFFYLTDVKAHIEQV